MLSRTILALSFVALGTSFLAASSTVEQNRNRKAQMRFEGMDRNGDGMISREEWSGSERSFSNHDWNGDGRLSGDEVRPGAQRNNSREGADHQPGRAERNLNWTATGFTRLDHNRDNRITADEWHYDLESFRRADRNRDDELTRQEFLNGDGEDDDREDSFDDLDVNNNGLVERDEWHASSTMFSSLDRNRDGVLSRFEVVGSAPSRDTYDEFATVDRNRNSTIERGEWEWSAASFNSRDTNRDGKLSRSEFDTSGGAPAVGARTTEATQRVRVNSQQRWTDAAIDVRAGDTITFDANGTITMSTDNGDTAAPAGSTRGRLAPDAPVLKQLAGGLIMRIDGYGPIFIGNRTTFTAPVAGRVYLGVNDDHLPDNSGEFAVTIGVRGR